MDVSLALSDALITVLDYETTGTVRGFPNEPWQIGMVAMKQGRVTADSMYESLLRVDPNRPFNPYAPGRHAQLREKIAAAPAPHELWPRIQPRLTAVPLCAHNVATEKKFLRRMAPMHRFGPWIDTLRISRKAWPGCPSYALDDLIPALGLAERVAERCEGREAHDALYDAVAAAVLLCHLLEQPGWERVTIADLSAL